MGGNDYEIFSDISTIGHTVTSTEDTGKKLHFENANAHTLKNVFIHGLHENFIFAFIDI